MCTDDKYLGPGTNQPALYHDDVNTLIGYIGAERNNAETEAIRLSKQSDPAGVPAAHNAAGYAAGLDRAHEIVSSMWEAAVITADAANANLTKEEQPE